MATNILSFQLQPPRSNNKHQEESTKFNNSTNPQPKQTYSYLWNLSFNETRADNNQPNPSDSQNNANKESWHSPSMLIQIGLLVTGVIYTFFAALQWRAIRKQTNISDTNLKIAERAYINVSPKPPGLDFDKRGYIFLSLKIANFGETPAEITDIIVHWVEELPEVPNVRRESKEEEVFSGAFLVKNDWIYHNIRSPLLPNLPKIWEKEIKFFVYGHVDYVDMFNNRHRLGFARVYGYESSNSREDYRTDQEFQERNNLVFISKAGFNYEHEISPNEKTG